MQGDLFPTPRMHDAGGKVKVSLPPGVRGDAVFHGPNDRYRPRLRRWIGEAFPVRYMLSIGMNPSTAEAEFNDPTLMRDWGFARREGCAGLVKCNVVDYRATDPDTFRDHDVTPSSDVNLSVIMAEAAGAAVILVAHGKLHKRLQPHADLVMSELVSAGYELHCLGTNCDGSPKHSLYLKATTPLRPYRPMSVGR